MPMSLFHLTAVQGRCLIVKQLPAKQPWLHANLPPCHKHMPSAQHPCGHYSQMTRLHSCFTAGTQATSRKKKLLCLWRLQARSVKKRKHPMSILARVKTHSSPTCQLVSSSRHCRKVGSKSWASLRGESRQYRARQPQMRLCSPLPRKSKSFGLRALLLLMCLAEQFPSVITCKPCASERTHVHAGMPCPRAEQLALGLTVSCCCACRPSHKVAPMTRDEAAQQWLDRSPDVDAMEDVVPRRPTSASSHGGGWSAGGGCSFNGVNAALGSFHSLGQSSCACSKFWHLVCSAWSRMPLLHPELGQ